ncbi:MAG: hypothetical protein ACC628_13175 [Pirellulaceae bacterium]
MIRAAKWQNTRNDRRSSCKHFEIFNEGGGLVFNTIHNILGNSPLENVQALLQAVQDNE